jgi:hypothetical protein
LDAYISRYPDDGMVILDFLGHGPAQNLENFPGTSTIPYLLSRLPDSFGFLANLTEICGHAFRTNFLRMRPVEFLRQFLPDFSLLVARVLLALAPLCPE